ncbi:MAG: formate dehydrogenase subunit delta [Pararhodobacter sp.]|nr:formate dehydrogenase subunit delta [Pararhodobacter sp.]
MSPEKMVHMANQIATFFRSQRGDDQAERVAAHLRDYWEPRMREQLKEYVAKGGEQLDALVIEASRQL